MTPSRRSLLASAAAAGDPPLPTFVADAALAWRAPHAPLPRQPSTIAAGCQRSRQRTILLKPERFALC